MTRDAPTGEAPATSPLPPVPEEDVDRRAAEIVLRLAPGRGVPDPRILSLVAEAPPPAPPAVWTDSDAAVLTAVYAARVRRDALLEESSLLTRYFDGVHLGRPGTLSSGIRSQLYAAAGEYGIAVGQPRIAASFGQQALLFADSDRLRYRALSVAALGHALNGEYLSAEADLIEAEEIFDRLGWPEAETAQLVLLAHVLVASAWLDEERLLRAAHRMRCAQPDDAYWQFSARAAEVMAQMFRRDYAAALADCRLLLNGRRRHRSNRVTHDLLVCMSSDILVAQGEHQAALAALHPHESPPGHGVCFSMQRSAALLALGREEELLSETAACVAEPDHCLRTLTPVLVRRSLAWSRLGSPRRARNAMESALLLIARTGFSATPFLMLPHDESRGIVDAVIAQNADLASAAPRFREMLARVTTPDAPSSRRSRAASFTPSERALAALLATPLRHADIARERGVSVNTVKSQLRSIYRKLGVGNRAEAVERLRDVGL